MGNKQVVLPLELKPERDNLLVRVGSRFDGGYIIPAALIARTEHILTFGLGYNWDFEKEMLSFGYVKRIDCYDHTVTPQALRRLYRGSILKYFLNRPKRQARIAAYHDYFRFFPGNPHVTHHMKEVGVRDGVDSISLDGALEDLPTTSNRIFLKCDIEGSEYAIMSDIVEKADRFCGIALEFHDLHHRFQACLEAMRALKKTHFIDHIHVNNTSKYNADGIPSVLEVSLSRRDVSAEIDARRFAELDLPLSLNGADLDTPNNPDKPDVTIHFR